MSLYRTCRIFVCVIVDLQTETIAKTTCPFLLISLFTYRRSLCSGPNCITQNWIRSWSRMAVK